MRFIKASSSDSAAAERQLSLKLMVVNQSNNLQCGGEHEENFA